MTDDIGKAARQAQLMAEEEAAREAQLKAEDEERAKRRAYAELEELTGRRIAEHHVEEKFREMGVDELDAVRQAREAVEVVEDVYWKPLATGRATFERGAAGGRTRKGKYKVDPELIREEFQRLRAKGLCASSARSHIVANSVRLFGKKICLSTVKTHTRLYPPLPSCKENRLICQPN